MASVVAPTHPPTFLATNAASGPRSQELPISSQQQPPEQDLYDDGYQGLFCKALFDYTAQDASALSFRRGDVIEVLNQQPSGWWDGLLGEERGWFPSNYVTIISLEEAELAFSGSDYSNGDGMTQSDSDTGVLGMSDVLMRGQVQNEEWLENEIQANNHLGNSSSTVPQGSQTNDFWEPNIMEDGRIFYVNSRTGQHSWDLPQETADEISDSELAGLSAQNVVRAATGAGVVFGVAAPANEINGSHPESAGFSVPRSTDVPEPWIKRLADDGQSYYYANKLTGQIMRTRPEASVTNGSHPGLESFIPSTTRRQRTESRNSVYSDNSDVHPLEYPRPPRFVTPDPMQQLQTPTAQTGFMQRGIELTPEELIAQRLQQVLAPPSPELVTDLASQAREAILAITDTVQGAVSRFGSDQRLDDLIQAAVRSVRNLLYISAANTSHMPNDLLGKESRDKSSSSPLKPAQRRVTATLSRLVLSARAIHYDSGSLISETLNRIEADALELERAISSFIVEVQRFQNDDDRKDGKSLKRLYGTFTTANIGVSLVGAGSAGSWTGFGWVSPESEAQIPKIPLGQNALAEVITMLTKIEGLCTPLTEVPISSGDDSEQIRQQAQEIITHISHFLTFVADIHIARHVDIDGYRQANDTIDDMYAQTLSKARALVRTFEAAIQAVYDDSSSLLLRIQDIPLLDSHFLLTNRASSYNLIESITSSLRLNLLLIRETLEALLSVGHEQAELAQGNYNGSIEWRLSRLSMTTSHFSKIERKSREFSGTDVDEEDMVDFELAMSKPVPPPKVSKSPAGPVESTQTLGQSVESINASASTLVSVSEIHEDDDVDTIDEDLQLYDKPKKVPRPPGTGKLIHLLGDDYADKLAAESQPWYLRANYNPSEIVIEEADSSVKGGTRAALVEKLTAHDKVDLPYTRAFLMTYKDFMTLDELFDLLVQRFTIQPPENLTPKELEDWTKLKQNVIRHRVFNTFKTMVIEQYVLDKDDMYILDRMMVFITRDDVVGMPAAKALKSVIERAQHNETNVKSLITTNPMPAPTPIMPRGGKKMKLLDIDALELARQLTIMESRMYQRIKPIEALKRAREQKMDVIDDIGIVIQTSNRIADWVANSILSKEDSRKRAQIVKHLINVADRCRLLNNFSSMIAITSGLNTPPIRRLKRTWEQVNQRSIAQFAACEVTIDNSKTFAKNRQLMASVTPPCVPFIGVFLSTLQFIVDGNADNLPPGNLVNFFKRQKASEVMDDIKRWQAKSYNLQPVPSILTFVEDSLNQFSNTDARASSDTFWQLSLEREPREREDEKMARLLQESGFL